MEEDTEEDQVVDRMLHDNCSVVSSRPGTGEKRSRPRNRGTVTPSQSLSSWCNLLGPAATPLPSREITSDSSLTLGAEYDREFVRRQEFAIDGGVDFLASPFDVKLSEKSQNAIGPYALIFVTSHVQVKLQPDGAFSPWLSFGGGYALFLESAPPVAPSLKPGTNTLNPIVLGWD
jgi:hypothetical protein